MTMSAMAHDGDMEIFFPRFGETRGLYPLLLVGAPLRALHSRSPQRNTASPFARVEVGKVTSAEVKPPRSGLRISSVHIHPNLSLAWSSRTTASPAQG